MILSFPDVNDDFVSMSFLFLTSMAGLPAASVDSNAAGWFQGWLHFFDADLPQAEQQYLQKFFAWMKALGELILSIEGTQHEELELLRAQMRQARKTVISTALPTGSLSHFLQLGSALLTLEQQIFPEKGNRPNVVNRYAQKRLDASCEHSAMQVWKPDTQTRRNANLLVAKVKEFNP